MINLVQLIEPLSTYKIKAETHYFNCKNGGGGRKSHDDGLVAGFCIEEEEEEKG